MIKKIKSLEKKGIQFIASHLIEIFPAPLPHSFDKNPVSSAADLFRMSISEGFNELYLNDSDILYGECQGKEYQFSLTDFVRWQLERMEPLTIFYLINKTDASVDNILDFDIEYEKDEEYYPEGWLNAFQSKEYLDKGLAYIQRLKREVPDEFYKSLTDAILNKDYGLLNENWYESELDDNLDQIRKSYSHWKVPLMVISTGKFLPYIASENIDSLAMEDYKLEHMYIRNYDEGDKA